MLRKLQSNWRSTFLIFIGILLSFQVNAGYALLTVVLQDIDSGTTSPTGQYRWRDVADHLYSESYRNTYNYKQANVQVMYSTDSTSLYGILSATNLKPNFAYQLKLVGNPGTADNEAIGLAGRWWQEEWSGTAWINGQNLNNKGDGSSPNPNDQVYFERRDVNDLTSPTGKHYKYTGYLVLDYFLTDSNGVASLEFKANSSYHVLWKTSQRARTSQDGPLKTVSFDVNLPHFAYDVSYPQTSVSIFGEWERLPVGGVALSAGSYTASLIITEESFHGSGGSYAGSWAAAMGGAVEFTISSCIVDFNHFARFASQWLTIDCNEPFWCGGADLNHINDVDNIDLGLFVEKWLDYCPDNWPLK